MSAAFMLFLVNASANAQDAVASIAEVPQVGTTHHTGEMAGYASMLISVVIGTMITLEKLGVLRRLGSSSAAPSVPPVQPAVLASDLTGFESIHTRLATMVTRLAAVEQTVTSIDARDRADAAALARMEGQMSAWDARLLRIENAVVGGKNSQ